MTPTEEALDLAAQREWGAKRAKQAHAEEDHALATLLENLCASQSALVAERDEALKDADMWEKRDTEHWLALQAAEANLAQVREWHATLKSQRLYDELGDILAQPDDQEKS